jgi:hypothetical protein
MPSQRSSADTTYIFNDPVAYRRIGESHASAFFMDAGSGAIGHILAGVLRGLRHQLGVFSLAHFLGGATTERSYLESEEGMFLVRYHSLEPFAASLPHLPLSYS